MTDQQPADEQIPNVVDSGGNDAKHVKRQPSPADEVEAMEQAGFALAGGAYRPRTRVRVVA